MYDDCIYAGLEDNTTSFNGCAPISDTGENNNQTSGWCKEGDFWQAANYTIRNTITVPWDGTSIDASISAEIVEKLNVIFANASGYNQTTCLCRDNRMLGASPPPPFPRRPAPLQRRLTLSLVVQDGRRTW